MDINRLNKKVIIEENQGSTNDGGGNKTPNWVPIATAWAEVRPTSAYEASIADKYGQYTTHMVKIRYIPNIKKEKHRINFNGRILPIQYIINTDEKNIELNFQCREG